MLFGAHVSIAGGIDKAPERAAAIGCEVFQMFSRSPQGGQAAPITDALAAQFQENMRAHGQKECYIHTPYILNLASSEKRIVENSVRMIRDELKRGSMLGAKYVMTHLGSAKDAGAEEARKAVAENLKRILDAEYETTLLMEISAGAGAIIGSTFEDLAYFIDQLAGHRIGVCLDTAHMFASGYDIRDPERVKKTFDLFDAVVGMSRLKMFHANDSQAGFGEKKDRHAHIGEGHIGREGFAALVAEPRLQKYNFICETEHDKVADDIAILKELREKHASQ